MRLLGAILGSLLLLWFAALLWLYLTQRQILFHPTGEHRAQEGFVLETPDGGIRVEVRNPGREKALLYFPGNSEHWWEDPDDLARLLPDHTIYFPHYPGYGASEGSPSQEAFFRMAEALYSRVAPRHKSVDLLGRSLGSGVALHLAARRPVGKVVLVTPYDSIAALGAERYPIFPVRAIAKDPFESILDAPNVDAPVLIILAENDRVIPLSHSQNLLRHFRRTEPRTIILPGTDHGNIIEHPDYATALRNFLEKETQGPPPTSR
jgi:pimeloyl-ACP methyl ester carboxylesterase